MNQLSLFDMNIGSTAGQNDAPNAAPMGSGS